MKRKQIEEMPRKIEPLSEGSFSVEWANGTKDIYVFIATDCGAFAVHSKQMNVKFCPYCGGRAVNPQ